MLFYKIMVEYKDIDIRSVFVKIAEDSKVESSYNLKYIFFISCI